MKKGKLDKITRKYVLGRKPKYLKKMKVKLLRA